MAPTIAVLATLDTKGTEAAFVKEHIEALGGEAILIDMGLVGEPGTSPDVDRAALIAAGGSSLETLLENPDRQEAAPILIAGATAILRDLLSEGRIGAVLGFGGTQGSSNCSAVMQALPYGFPKILLSTMASGDTSSFVGIKDITMMFPVSDILGLNPLARTILANAAACAWGMAQAAVPLERSEDGRAVIAMTNLGVLTDGTMHALKRFEEAGYEVIVFHAVGSGGLAMEQLMKEGHVQAVFDYGLGEIADEIHGGLRAANPERLTVAGQLGLPQVIVPGGTEHIGLF
ncbi:MAG: Tm-1-like ATP-binding domain-containing protein, partial [bacterium]